MALPARDVAVEWVGKTVLDRNGVAIGPCTVVFADDATGVAEWLRIDLGARAVAYVPLVDATESGNQVRVSVELDQITKAPPVAATTHLSEDEERALYRHYGIEASTGSSETLLPASESAAVQVDRSDEDHAVPENDHSRAEAPAQTFDVPAPAADRPVAVPTDHHSVPASSHDPVPAAPPAVPTPAPASLGAHPAAPPAAAPSRRRQQILAAALAALAAVGAVITVRRVRSK
jgi:hypothetical protein